MKIRVTSHHGEIIQGYFKEGYALVTLPCPLYWTEAEFTPDDALIVPTNKPKVQQVLTRLGIKGRISLSSNIPEKWGLGSSTADMLAAIRASTKLSPEEEARVLASIEGTDPIMFSDAVLFETRTGEVLENFGKLPHMKIIGFNTDPEGMTTGNAGRPIENIEAFEKLRSQLRSAIDENSARGVAEIATESAEYIQKVRPKKHWRTIRLLAEKHGALGIQVAHSGTVTGLIFEPDHDHNPVIEEVTEAFGESWHFNI